jgi:succinate dehydrogenase hydrophobic anchor subunit
MDWILDIYEQTEHLFAVSSIVILIVSLYLVYVLRFPKMMYNESYDCWTRIMGAVIWYLIFFCLIVVPAHCHLREKCQERKEAQIEQVRQEQLVK